MTDLYFYGITPTIDNITFLDYPEPVGHALSIFFTGCEHHCSECQNPELQKHGLVKDKIPFLSFVTLFKELLTRLRTNKCVLLGGDPLDNQNKEFTKALIEHYPEVDFCVYTGYSLNSLTEPYVRQAKYVKTGVYDLHLKQKSEKTGSYFSLASSNQKLYKREGNKFILISKNGRADYAD